MSWEGGKEKETKHLTGLERFWNRKKEYSTIFEKKTKISRLECPKGQFAYFRSFYASFWAV
jgi:hypothetical protein